MSTKKKVISSSNKSHEKSRPSDIVDSLIAYKRKIKPKEKKNEINFNPIPNKPVSGFYSKYKLVNDSSETSGSTKFLYEKDPDLLIREYFLAKPSARRNLRKCIAKHINSIAAVLEILDWSNKSHVQEAYDGAIDILAECNDVILKVASKRLIDYTTSDTSAQEEKWEVIIKGIACSQNISAQRKFNVITKLISEKTNSRLVKAAIIDALLIIQDEVDVDSIKSQLAGFVTSDEPDEHIQKYAKEAMEEIS